jgi:hypothetical protein
MKKIVINTSYGDPCDGGFAISHRALVRLRELGQQHALADTSYVPYWPSGVSAGDAKFNRCGVGIPRDDGKLIQVIEELGDAANGHGAMLKIVEVPDDVEWLLERSGAVEHVSEPHRTWR